MSVFNFMETIFFISLGITFVLILLLVYHFKQRITTIEQKTDTMLEIINNVVKEIYVLKNAQQINTRFFTTTNNNENVVHIPAPTVNYLSTNKINVSDEDDSDGDEDEDHSDDDGDEDDDDGDEDGDSDDDEPIIKELDIEEITSYEILPSLSEDAVKVINVSLNEMDIPIEDNGNEVDEDVTDLVEIDNLTSSPIQVEKMEAEETENLEEDVSHEESSQKEHSKDVYRKMTLQSLKALVITKGLCSDPSKLKKPELLKMLETVDE